MLLANPTEGLEALPAGRFWLESTGHCRPSSALDEFANSITFAEKWQRHRAGSEGISFVRTLRDASDRDDKDRMRQGLSERMRVPILVLDGNDAVQGADFLHAHDLSRNKPMFT